LIPTEVRICELVDGSDIGRPLSHPINPEPTCPSHCPTSMRFETTLENPGQGRVSSQKVHGTIEKI
jgi:hypothetical protein